jgi:hypothetical protein
MHKVNRFIPLYTDMELGREYTNREDAANEVAEACYDRGHTSSIYSGTLEVTPENKTVAVHGDAEIIEEYIEIIRSEVREAHREAYDNSFHPYR